MNNFPHIPYKVLAKEIMLGNWLLDEKTGKYFQSYEETPADILSTNHTIKPIPLTRDILDKLMFDNSVWSVLSLLDKHGAEWYIKYCRGIVFLEQENEQGMGNDVVYEILQDIPKEERNNVGFVRKEECILIPKYIYYLHQLQNFVYWTTRVELNVNL